MEQRIKKKLCSHCGAIGQCKTENQMIMDSIPDQGNKISLSLHFYPLNGSIIAFNTLPYCWQNDFLLSGMVFAQQGRQREPSVKTLCPPLSAEFWRHCFVEWQNSTPRLTSIPQRRNGNINMYHIK